MNTTPSTATLYELMAEVATKMREVEALLEQTTGVPVAATVGRLERGHVVYARPRGDR